MGESEPLDHLSALLGQHFRRIWRIDLFQRTVANSENVVTNETKDYCSQKSQSDARRKSYTFARRRDHLGGRRLTRCEGCCKRIAAGQRGRHGQSRRWPLRWFRIKATLNHSLHGGIEVTD